MNVNEGRNFWSKTLRQSDVEGDGDFIDEATGLIAAHIAGHDIALQTTYGNVQPGEYLALVNSFGVIEIAKSESSAAEGLGVERGAPITVTNT